MKRASDKIRAIGHLHNVIQYGRDLAENAQRQGVPAKPTKEQAEIVNQIMSIKDIKTARRTAFALLAIYEHEIEMDLMYWKTMILMVCASVGLKHGKLPVAIKAILKEAMGK